MAYSGIYKWTPPRNSGGIPRVSTRFTLSVENEHRLTRDGTVESISQDQFIRSKRGQGNFHFPCSADHEQDWQPYPVDPYSARSSDDHIYYYKVAHNLYIYLSYISTTHI